jgi:hypothetical protein
MPLDELSRIAQTQIVNIRRRLAEARAQEFPTNSPELFADILDRLLTELENFIPQTTDVRLHQYCCQSLNFIGSHIRYLEGASSSKVPAQLIGSIEELIRRTRPDARVLLRVQWNFNYTVIDILEVYRSTFATLLDPAAVDRALNGISAFYLVGIPTVERANVLLHAALGHEAGHRLANMFLNAENQTQLVAKVRGSMGNLSWYPGASSLPPIFQFNLSQQLLDRILKTRRRALEELISDVVGWKTFGISALCALRDIGITSVLDALPDEQRRLYPPWRLRFRAMMIELHEGKLVDDVQQLSGGPPIDLIRVATLEYLRVLNETATDFSDWTALNSDGVLLRAYEDVSQTLLNARSYVASSLNATEFSSDIFRAEVKPLLERLARGIPPDQLEDSSIPDFRSAIAAGWLYKIARLPVPYENTRNWNADDDETLNRLVLKAIESIELKKSFKSWEASSSQP